MGVYVAFVDDSASHAQSPVMILAGVVARYTTWKHFADAWAKALISGKSLKNYNGNIYFKSYDAATRKKCFAGFSEEEANEKINLLTDIALDHILYGMVCAVKWVDYKEVTIEHSLPPDFETLWPTEHPYFVCFPFMIDEILKEQLNRGRHQVIDFVFDEQGKLLPQMIEKYKEHKLGATGPKLDIMGKTVPGDDVEDLPIQAADLIAWQYQNGSWPYMRPETSSARNILNSGKIYKRSIDRSELEMLMALERAAMKVRIAAARLEMRDQ